MKNLKLISIVVFSVISAMIISSCGITKNSDFSSQKYTNFKKGKTTVSINPATKETQVVNLPAKIIEKATIANTEAVADNETTQSQPTIKTETKKTAVKKAGNTNVITKETKKEKLTRSASFVKNHLIDKPNTTSLNGDGLSVLWVVVLILLLLWALGLWGFGAGGLINVLLVIALILLILWLLRVV